VTTQLIMAKVLVVGATGTVGNLVIDSLLQNPGKENIKVVAAIRKKEQEEQFHKRGIETRMLNLDDPNTHEEALKGIERLFLLTGYTVAMLSQSKNLIDAAKKQNVKHVTHIGIFSIAGGNTTKLVDHFIWHLYIENYIESSGIQYTFLHPNIFMQNLGRFASKGKISIPLDSSLSGWIDARDIADVAAESLRHSSKFANQNIMLSTESLSGKDVAKAFTEITGKEWVYEPTEVAVWAKGVIESGMESAYARCVINFFDLISKGKLPELALVYPDVVPKILGRPAYTVRDYIKAHLTQYQFEITKVHGI